MGDATVPELLVNIDVEDLERAIRFYFDGLGLKPGRRLGPQGREMLGASSPVYLLANEAGTPPFAEATSRREYRRHWTPVHRAQSAGSRLEGSIEERAWGSMARMADPFGHGFCLLQFKGGGYDETAADAPSE